MFAKLLTAQSLDELEKKLGTYFSELENGAAVSSALIEKDRNKVLVIHHVHSFITQEVGKTASITVNGPGREIITRFSLMIIAGYE